MATQTVIQEQRLPKFQEDFLKSIFAQAEALKGTQQPFAPQQLAEFSDVQNGEFCTRKQREQRR